MSADHNQKGNVIIEMALVIFVGIILISGIADYGLALQEHSVMVDAARMSARAAGNAPSSASGGLIKDSAIQFAGQFMSRFNYQPNDYAYTVSSLSQNGILTVKVTVERRTNRFAFLVNSSFPSCASAAFQVLSGVAPENEGTPGC